MKAIILGAALTLALATGAQASRYSYMGGHYSGGHGSSHRGGHYVNARTGNHYTHHYH